MTRTNVSLQYDSAMKMEIYLNLIIFIFVLQRQKSQVVVNNFFLDSSSGAHRNG